MSTLITSDLHLTDKPQDEYRWGLFDWIAKQVLDKDVDTLLFLGDTTDAKDRHSSNLTNRVVDTFTNLAGLVKNFYILRGNHDYIDENVPFFKFLNYLPNLTLVTEPYGPVYISGKKSLLVPNTRDFRGFDWSDYELIFCHQTFQGAIVENGQRMDGIPMDMFEGWNGKIISGDIHVPQTLYNGKIEYVGAPYHIRFNDKFSPRVMILTDEGRRDSVKYKTLNKHTLIVTSPEEVKAAHLVKGDQVKVRLSITDISDWENYKDTITQYCNSIGVDLQQVEFVKKDFSLSLKQQETKLKSLTPKEIFDRYCEFAKVGEETKSYGNALLEE